MKYFILFVFITLFHNVNGQSKNDPLEGIFDIYSEEADPYLKKFATYGFVDDGSKEYDQAVRASYNKFLADIYRLESIIRKELKKNPELSENKNFISKIIADQYRQEFVGLPMEFWDSVRKRVEEI